MAEQNSNFGYLYSSPHVIKPFVREKQKQKKSEYTEYKKNITIDQIKLINQGYIDFISGFKKIYPSELSDIFIEKLNVIQQKLNDSKYSYLDIIGVFEELENLVENHKDKDYGTKLLLIISPARTEMLNYQLQILKQFV